MLATLDSKLLGFYYSSFSERRKIRKGKKQHGGLIFLQKGRGRDREEKIKRSTAGPYNLRFLTKLPWETPT